MIYFHFLSLGRKCFITIRVHLNRRLQFSQHKIGNIRYVTAVIKFRLNCHAVTRTEEVSFLVVVLTCGALGNKVTQ